MISTMRSLTLLFALVAFTLGPSSAFADGTTPSSDANFRFANEEFYYSIQVNGVEAMRVGVRAGDVKYRKGNPYVPIAGTAKSTGFFHSVYPVDDRAHTFVHPETFRPLRSEKYFDENGKKREYKVDFTHSNYKARVEKKRAKRTNKFTMAIPGTTHDMITWFYDLRTRDDLKEGAVVTFFVYDGWKLSRITGRVVGRDDVHTPMGWFKTWKIEFQRDVMRSRRQKNKEPILRVKDDDAARATVWITRDDNRLPVKMAVDFTGMSAEAVLIKFKVPKKP